MGSDSGFVALLPAFCPSVARSPSASGRGSPPSPTPSGVALPPSPVASPRVPPAGPSRVSGGLHACEAKRLPRARRPTRHAPARPAVAPSPAIHTVPPPPPPPAKEGGAEGRPAGPSPRRPSRSGNAGGPGPQSHSPRTPEPGGNANRLTSGLPPTGAP